MTPIVISITTENLSISKLRQSIIDSATAFLNLDFKDVEAANKQIIELEEYVTEALLRLSNDKFGYKPLQNKLYEKVELLFMGDHYNINRMLSILRRSKTFPIDSTDEKYISWVHNRVKYATKSIRTKLKTIDYTTIEHA